MDILVTGAAGFLGRSLCRQLCASGHRVVGLGRRGPEDETVPWITVDLSSDGWIEALPRRIDAVVHLAQSDQYREFPAGAKNMFHVNVASTARLADYALQAGARSFVLASTGSVYEPYSLEMTEAAPLSPKSFYSASKLAAETLLIPYEECMAVCILRLFFLYGPGGSGRLISTLVDRIQGREAVVIDGPKDGLVMTPTYVDDVAEIFDRAVADEWDGIINIAANEPLSISEIAGRIGARLGIEVIFHREIDREPARIVPDLRKLASLTGLTRFRSFDAGLTDMFDG